MNRTIKSAPKAGKILIEDIKRAVKAAKMSDQWQTPQWLFDELNAEFNFDIDLCATAENSKCKNYGIDYLKNLISFCTESEDTGEKGRINLYSGIAGTGLKSAFMNPPYSNPKPFIEKAWEDSKHCKIVLLVKVDPSTKWWSTFWNYEDGCYCPHCDHAVEIWADRWQCKKDNSHQSMTNIKPFQSAGPKPGCKVRFLPKRVKFDPPQELIDSGEVVKNLNGKWYKKLKNPDDYMAEYNYEELSGPTFPSCILIFDRRST